MRLPLPRLALFALLTTVVAPVAPALAQPVPQQSPEGSLEDQDSVRIDITGAARPKVHLALPAATYGAVLPPTARAAAEELEETLRQDLELSGVFTVHGPEETSKLRLTGDQNRDFEHYRSLGTEVALLTEISVEGDRIAIKGRLYDLIGRSLILGKKYRGTFDLSRRISHTFSDEIILYFTGRRGNALTSIAFTSDRDGNGIKELYVMDYDGYDQRRISGHKSLSFTPSWSADGSGLAYASFFEGPPSLYFADRETGRKSPILVDERQTTAPNLSADGQSLVFSRSLDGNMEIFSCNLHDCKNTMQRLTSSAAIDTNPAWSPDDRRIAFTSSRSGSPQIYVMNADGSGLERITLQGRYNDGVDWHPDGRRITFAHRARDGSRFDIAVVDIETGEQRLLTGAPGSHEAPVYSPDGRFIAFESSQRGGKQIYLMTAEGEPVRRLTSTGENFAPSWSNYLK